MLLSMHKMSDQLQSNVVEVNKWPSCAITHSYSDIPKDWAVHIFLTVVLFFLPLFVTNLC